MKVKLAMLLLGSLLAQSSSAGLVFFGNDMSGFASAVSSQQFIGTEDFETSNLADNSAMGFEAPLNQTSTTSPYPNGITQPITVDTVNGLQGSDNLAAFRNMNGIVSTVVVANDNNDTVDWLFDSSLNVTGVGLNPVTYVRNNPTATTTMNVSVFDAFDNLLGTTTIGSDGAGSNHLGIQATGGMTIGRINFEAPSLINGDSVFEGADNGAIYVAVPEANGMACCGIGILVCMVTGWLRRLFPSNLENDACGPTVF